MKTPIIILMLFACWSSVATKQPTTRQTQKVHIGKGLLDPCAGLEDCEGVQLVILADPRSPVTESDLRESIGLKLRSAGLRVFDQGEFLPSSMNQKQRSLVVMLMVKTKVIRSESVTGAPLGYSGYTRFECSFGGCATPNHYVLARGVVWDADDLRETGDVGAHNYLLGGAEELATSFANDWLKAQT